MLEWHWGPRFIAWIWTLSLMQWFAILPVIIVGVVICVFVYFYHVGDINRGFYGYFSGKDNYPPGHIIVWFVIWALWGLTYLLGVW